ncbi:hypothetical protein SYNTR_2141 [Candidatus Syntrophocurvum alkaliphilum]|uniref:TATA-box binding protein n=1 Tax=Candidatus Syntrophocurvum alkaliphilum TaxID=2293317 RepID=A0A6I6DDV3_9FIRM|nr:YwmB family TATA-box binding protein [Candidatus Syntrophocurvum alkaliphilum]QGU00735.1 hypothetical protein SYNTR_2141 [Candidatus Syntrophocurvum alkaliphilum]
MKRFLLYIIIFAALCHIADTSIHSAVSRDFEKRSPYQLSFASIGANLLEFRMDSWAKIKINTTEEMKQQLKQSLDILEIEYCENNLEYRKSGTNDIIYYNTVKNGDEIDFTLEYDPNNCEAFYLVTITSNKSLEHIKSYHDRLTNNFNIRSYYLLTGKIDYPIEYTAKYNLIQVALKNVGAEEINVFKDGRVVSVTGYSELLENTILSEVIQNKEYNIQIAMRSSQVGKTYIYMGFPLILGEY